MPPRSIFGFAELRRYFTAVLWCLNVNCEAIRAVFVVKVPTPFAIHIVFAAGEYISTIADNRLFAENLVGLGFS